MQAIQCKYHGPTNTKGSRISASCAAKTIYIDYPHELSGQAVYRKAAEKLAKSLGWFGQYYGDTLIGGCLKDDSYVFVFDNAFGRE